MYKINIIQSATISCRFVFYALLSLSLSRFVIRPNVTMALVRGTATTARCIIGRKLGRHASQRSGRIIKLVIAVLFSLSYPLSLQGSRQ
jgi:hypothetical protein